MFPAEKQLPYYSSTVARDSKQANLSEVGEIINLVNENFYKKLNILTYSLF